MGKKLARFRNNTYLCTQNNGRVPFIGIGVSPIGRVVRFVATLFLWLVRINLEAHQLAILLKDVVFQNVVGQVDALRIQYMASQRIGYHLAQGCRKV